QISSTFSLNPDAQQNQTQNPAQPQTLGSSSSATSRPSPTFNPGRVSSSSATQPVQNGETGTHPTPGRDRTSHSHTYTHIETHTHTYRHIHTNAYTLLVFFRFHRQWHTPMQIDLLFCTHIHTRTNTHTHIRYKILFKSMYIYIYIDTNTNTITHIQAHKNICINMHAIASVHKNTPNHIYTITLKWNVTQSNDTGPANHCLCSMPPLMYEEPNL